MRSGRAHGAVISKPGARRSRDRIDPQLGVAQQMTAISLGMPSVPTKLAERRKSRQIQVGTVAVGGDAPVSVQSMTTTRTSDIGATLQQIAELTASGCQIVRVACPTQDDADALADDRAQVADPGHRGHPLPAEVRLRRDRRRLRGGAGEPGQHQAVRRQGQGDRAGREGRRHADPDRRQRRARWTSGCWRSTAGRRPRRWSSRRCGRRSLFEEHGFRDIKISVKHNDPVVMVNAYRQLAAPCDYPLHLGVTEAGPAFQGTIKSAVAFGALLARGHRRHHPGLAVGAAGGGGQGRHPDPGVAEPAAARPGDRLLPVLRPRPGRRLQAGRGGHRGPGGHGGPAARRGDGLRGERSGRGPRGRPRCRLRQRQGADLRQGRGHQDRPRVEDRGDPDRGGDEDRRADGGGRRRLRRAVGRPWRADARPLELRPTLAAGPAGSQPSAVGTGPQAERSPGGSPSHGNSAVTATYGTGHGRRGRIRRYSAEISRPQR